MKKFYSLMLAMILSVSAYAQVTVTVSGTTVTLSSPVPGADWGSSPVNMYAYADSTDTTPNVPSTVQILGDWPGMAMIDNGSGTFSVSVDLSTKFPVGTTINNFKFIYNSPDGGGGYYQNPAGGSPGFNITDPAHATGYSPVTITTMSTTDFVNIKNKSIVVNGQLRTALPGNLSLEIFEMGGKLVKSFKATSTGNAIDLNLTKNGLYLLKITNGTNREVVKFSK